MKSIYLDHGATTPVLPQVIEVMLPFWTVEYGNPSSAHRYGRFAEGALEEAREQIAQIINASPGEIVFTGCGSESDNLALRGVMAAARHQANHDGPLHMIISAIEHSAVKNTAQQLCEQFGHELTILPVDRFGQIRLEELEEAIRPDTAIVSIMAASNEIGTTLPIEQVGEIAREHGVLFHTDAIQAAAVMRWDLATMPVDLLSIAPHKFYGPKGVGMLYVREGTALQSPFTGGGQETGRRSGTENVPYAVGAAEAFRLAVEEMDERNSHYCLLRDRLIEGVLAQMPGQSVLTGHPSARLPHNASFAFQGVNGNDLLMHLDIAGIAASSGSACKVGDPKPSSILQALGLGEEWTMGGLRLTVGKQNTVDEIDYVLSTLPPIVKKLRNLG
jgi:cysteine desulfurase